MIITDWRLSQPTAHYNKEVIHMRTGSFGMSLASRRMTKLRTRRHYPDEVIALR